MQLTFLGSGDAFAGGGRFQACLHLAGGDEPLLLDCGATTLVALKRADIDPASIGFVALSHLHGDHFAGLPWLILDGQFSKRTRPLEIAGPAGVRERVERTFEALYPGAAAVERAFETDLRRAVRTDAATSSGRRGSPRSRSATRAAPRRMRCGSSTAAR